MENWRSPAQPTTLCKRGQLKRSTILSHETSVARPVHTLSWPGAGLARLQHAWTQSAQPVGSWASRSSTCFVPMARKNKDRGGRGRVYQLLVSYALESIFRTRWYVRQRVLAYFKSGAVVYHRKNWTCLVSPKRGQWYKIPSASDGYYRRKPIQFRDRWFVITRP